MKDFKELKFRNAVIVSIYPFKAFILEEDGSMLKIENGITTKLN